MIQHNDEPDDGFGVSIRFHIMQWAEIAASVKASLEDPELPPDSRADREAILEKIDRTMMGDDK